MKDTPTGRFVQSPRLQRGPIFGSGYRPQFSGHETFPLRYGWLKKSFDAIRDAKPGDNRWVFADEAAIARFGVGKNMVGSMRHWAGAAGVIESNPESPGFRCTRFGRFLFEEDYGVDPYMEHPSTSWMIHWHLAGRPDKTTWFWSFNNFPALSFERDQLARDITSLAKSLSWPRSSAATIKRDVACFVRTYVAQPTSKRISFEDSLESPLIELALIKPTGHRGGFRFVRGPKPSLGLGAFVYAVSDFWGRTFNSANTLSFEVLAHEPGSPGRVFMLDENSLIELLGQLEQFTNGAVAWSETAGLKQLIRRRTYSTSEALILAGADYSNSDQRGPDWLL